MLDLNLDNHSVESSEALFEGEFGRLRNAEMGHGGHLYILTSNQDGRGDPENNDDRILRVIPLESNVQKGDISMKPLKQIKAGILPENVSCKDGFELLFKASNGNPACVKENSVNRLIEIGWAHI